VIQEPGAILECMETGLLRRRLRWGCEKIGDFLDTFCEVKLRLLAQTVAVGL
jgi:hypothetical protein